MFTSWFLNFALHVLWFSPSWRFQIQQGNNQQIVLSQWLQGQRSQQGRQGESLTEPPGQGQPVNSIETTVDISGSDNPVSNQSPSNEQTIPSPPTTQATPNASTNPFSAINQFLEQNPEMYGVLQTLLAYIPFLILILFKEIYKHTSGKYNSCYCVTVLTCILINLVIFLRYTCYSGFGRDFYPCW
jgi:hypothetical protein